MFSIVSMPREGEETEHLMITATTDIDVTYGVEQAAGPANAYGYSFDKALQTSRVYSRAAQRPTGSLSSASDYSLGWSFFSSLSLSRVSNLSVLGLLVSKDELYNKQMYSSESQDTHYSYRPAPPLKPLGSLKHGGEFSSSILLLGMCP